MALRATSRFIQPFSRMEKLPNLRGAPVAGYNMFFTKQPCYLITSSTWATNQDNCPAASRYLDRLNNRTESLWWSAIATAQLASKRVVRSWATRRLRIAFAESLKNHGYRPDGSRIDNQENLRLMGTIQMFANQAPLITMPKTELMKRMDFHIRLVIERQDEFARKAGKFSGQKGQKSWNNGKVSRTENFRKSTGAPGKSFTIRRF